MRSMRGVEVNMAKYIAENETAIAVGNAGLNARGDMVDRHGRIVKKREVIANEYHASNPRAVKRVMSLKDLADMPAVSPAEALTQATKGQVAQKTPSEKPTGRRKLSDS